MKPPPIPPKPTLPKGLSASAPSSRRSSVDMEIESVQSSAEIPDTQSSSASRGRRAHSLGYIAFQQKLMEYHSTENADEKATLFQAMRDIANPERPTRRIRPDEAQELEADLEAIRLAEFVRGRSQSLPELTQKKPIIIKTTIEFIKPTASLPSIAVPVALDDEQPSTSSAIVATSQASAKDLAATEASAFKAAELKPKFTIGDAQLAQLLTNTSANALNIKEINSQDKTGQSFTHFYCNDVFIGEVTPNDETFRPGFGSAQKYLAAKNDLSVVIQHRRRFAFKNTEEKELRLRKNNLFSELSTQLSATCLNYMVDERGKIVTQNGGQDLHSFLTSDDDVVINISSFANVAKDLSLLHSKGVHHLDLKPENFAFDGAKVNLIDTDAMPVMPSQTQLSDVNELKVLNKVSYPEFTSDYLPALFQTELGGLYNKRTDLASLGRIRRAADTFGLLMTMMEATENEFFVNEIDTTRNVPKPRGAGLRTRPTFYLDENNQRQEESEAELERAANWASTYVKPEFVENFLSFMQDPFQYIRSKNPEFSVSNIINWNATASDDGDS